MLDIEVLFLEKKKKKKAPNCLLYHKSTDHSSQVPNSSMQGTPFKADSALMLLVRARNINFSA